MEAKSLRIVFMGTPEFAATSLRKLVAERYNVVAVVTTPDKPAGRGQKLHQSDVKVVAEELGLPILQPEKLRDEEFLAALRSYEPDLGVVIAFRMLPEVVWAMPKLGTFNLHASLLPEYRGAAPINWAIMNGETRTGVTTFLLNHEIDKGDIIEQKTVNILKDDNIGTLYTKLMNVGSELVTHTINKITSSTYTTIKQARFEHCTLKPAPKIFKEDCRINWYNSVERAHNMVRGLSPYPAAWTPLYRDGAECGSIKIFASHIDKCAMNVAPGTIRTDSKSYIAIACADGWLYIDDVQLAGKKRLATKDLLLGWRDVATLRCSL